MYVLYAVYVYVYTYMYVLYAVYVRAVCITTYNNMYGVAPTCKLLKSVGLFCK